MCFCVEAFQLIHIALIKTLSTHFIFVLYANVIEEYYFDCFIDMQQSVVGK